MKIKHIFKGFKKETTEIEIVDTWVVKWLTVKFDTSFGTDGSKWTPNSEWVYMSFTNEDLADSYAASIKLAFKLIGASNFYIKKYKQVPPTNI